jgi:hypothetical protein
MRRACGGLAALALVAGTALAAPATSSPPVVPVPTGGILSRGHSCQASVRPGIARIGQPVLYRGRVLVRRGTDLRWQVPADGGAFEWGSPRMRRIPAYSGSRNRSKEVLFADTLQVEVSLQAFTPGMLSVPGLAFEVREANGSRWTGHLPVVRLGVAPVVSPDDTSASLRPLRGPLGAPWWERVPWRIVGLVALATVVVAFIVWRLGRRRAPLVESVRARPPKDPATVALEALEALRGLRLPERERFAGHAFELTRILRRFLEATQGAPRPGDSTPELVAHLGATRLAPAERERVAELLAAWDRVKFACAASSLEEARRAEVAVEGLARLRLPGVGEGSV